MSLKNVKMPEEYIPRFNACSEVVIVVRAGLAF